VHGDIPGVRDADNQEQYRKTRDAIPTMVRVIKARVPAVPTKGDER
jgi:hypothetical protein